MSWIKRNLALVISGVIALGLLGFGGWYLWSAVEKNNSIDNEINQTKAEIERLLNMDPSPNQSNLVNAKRELDRLSAFITEAKKQFPPTPAPAEPLNNESFKSLLETTVNDLHKQAASVGIKVPTHPDGPYYFTFESERLPVTFPPESLRPLSERLHEVQTMMSILIKSRINKLNYIRRAVVPGERVQSAIQGGVSDYLSIPPRTNAETSMVLWPYEVDFDCFTSELGTVLEELERTRYAVIVKAPVVVPAEEIRMRAPRPTNAPPATLTTVINERLLRVTLRLEVIKPEPIQPGGGGPGRRGGPGGGP
jgi:hypothetical protein